MASRSEIFLEIQNNVTYDQNSKPILNFDSVLLKYIKEFSQYRNRNVIVYYSDFLSPAKGPNIDINDSDMTGFMNSCYNLDKSKGLDLILHTPGGSAFATEGIVKYLRKIFGNDIEVFVPLLAMSAGTMLACSCKKIWMGKESSLGPIDPQFESISAFNVKKEFEEVEKELASNPNSLYNWQIRLGKYPPAFYYTVSDSINLSTRLLSDWLKSNMFLNEKDVDQKVEKIASILNNNNGSHSKHFDYEECKNMGLKISLFENDSTIQDLILSIYHVCTIFGNQTSMCKIICNQNDRLYIINGFTSGGQ